MKLVIKATLVSMVCGLIASGSALAAETTKEATKAATTTAMCAWSDEAKMKDHFTKHVTYPTTGAQIKETCKKEMPNEFTAAERTCFNGKIQAKKTYKNADEVFAALNVK
jgi:hypothetical protein